MGFARRSSGVRWFFEVLHIQPIKINISLLPSAGMQEGEMSRQYRIVSSLGINLLDVANMPLKINAMILKNAFMQPKELMRQVLRHMMLQVSMCTINFWTESNKYNVLSLFMCFRP